MKVLFIFSACLVCFASASIYDEALDKHAADLVRDFWTGMEQAPHLADLAPEFADEANEVENEVKGQLTWSLREVLAKTLKHIRETFEKAEEAAKTVLIKAKELVEKLKNLKGVGEELQQRILEKVKDWIRNFLEKLNLNNNEYSLIRVPLELDEMNLMENVKNNILEKLNMKNLIEFVKEKLAKLGEVGRSLLEALTKPGALEKLKGLLEMILPGLHQDYSLGDFWNKVKDFFQGLGIKIAEKFNAFSDWVKDLAQRGWTNVKDKAGKLKELAKVVADKAGTMSKKVAEQALEFFKEHKEEIGQLVWSLVKGALGAAIASAG